jgi:hypothetical protein
MDGGDPVVRLPEQAGDLSGGFAGGDIHNISGMTAADVIRLLAEIRAITADTEHRGRMQDLEAEAHRVMTRQRLDVIAADQRAARWWTTILTVVVALAILVLAALVYDRLGVVAGLVLGMALAARIGR